QVDRDRRLIRKEAEELHLLEAEERPLRAIEDRQHPESTLLVQEWGGHQSLRDVAGVLGPARGEPGAVPTAPDPARGPRREHPAGDAGPRRKAGAEERILSLAHHRLEDELLRLGVEQEDRRRPGAEDRTGDLDDRGEKRAERLLRSDDAGRDGGSQIRLSGHFPPPTFVAVRYRTLFSWKGVSSGCFERTRAQIDEM